MLSHIALSSRAIVPTIARPLAIRSFASTAAHCSFPGTINGPVCYEDDIAHVQVNNGYSKKYAQGWERIFGKDKSEGSKKGNKK